ncbi:MAG: penicillin acylase family protein [Anaerolineae bacterium]|nr:penicillin acylase family protein [Anaerolineae bacterium]
MSSKLKKFLKLIVLLIIVLGVAGTVYWPRAIRNSFPTVDGTLQLLGLDAPVDVYRDSMGIPHIYAETEHDLFFAQGYIEAQDRFWQMDFQRHASSGRLSELLGSSTIETDIFLLTLGWERVARQELENLDERSLASLQDYADGVNAFLQGREGSQLSLEYVFINLLNSGYEPEPWQPLHTLTWAKAMAWDLKGNISEEITRSILLNTLTPEQVAELYPDYPTDRPYIVNNLSPFSLSTGDVLVENPNMDAEITAGLVAVNRQFALLDALLGGGTDDGIGSNSWAVSGELTASGLPLLANDPHLNHAIPHVWYQVGLHCAPKGPDCSMDVSGFSFAGTPGVVIGHNDRIAWGFTNVGPDVMDLYIEKINPENPNQYEVNGKWVDMELVTETIDVAGGDTVTVTARLTRHGPIISESYGALEDFTDKSGMELPEHYAISLRWTALEPSNTFRAIWNFNRAQNWNEFRQAAREFAVPAQNLLYADVDGNIGYQMPGNIPLRAGNSDGRYPVPGWTDEHEWRYYIPFNQLPYAYNPPEGYIVTANNAVVGPQYGYHIADTWAYGYRAQRIVDMIQQAPGPIDIAYFQTMQGDNKNLSAELLLPILMDIDLESKFLDNQRAILNGWDYQQHMDSGQAALYEIFWSHLLAATFRDDLPEDYWPNGGSRWFTVIRNLVDDPENAWWDDKNTDGIETRDDIFYLAFAAAVGDVEDMLGKDPARWTWGELHQIYFEHAVMSNFPLINKTFEQGPFPVSGGSSIVNNTNWKASNNHFWVSGSSPSFRMIVDLSNLQNSLVIHPTGQSGHAGHPHYIDMVDLWRNVQYIPMLWERSAIEGDAEGHLHLVP